MRSGRAAQWVSALPPDLERREFDIPGRGMKDRILFHADPEALGGNGAAAAETVAEPAAAASDGIEPAAAAAEETQQAGGFLQNVLAAVSSKASLIAEREELSSRLSAAEQAVGTLTAELNEAREKVEALTQERAAIEQALNAARDQAAGEDEKAAVIVASLGYQGTEDLPAAAAEPETKEALLARLEAETDNDKRWELAQRINAMG